MSAAVVVNRRPGPSVPVCVAVGCDGRPAGTVYLRAGPLPRRLHSEEETPSRRKGLGAEKKRVREKEGEGEGEGEGGREGGRKGGETEGERERRRQDRKSVV